MTYDPEGAIAVLKEGLESSDRPRTFAQADGLVRSRSLLQNIFGWLTMHICMCLQLIFELAWTLLSQRKYEEAAENFIRITTINSWFVLCAFVNC